MKLLNDSLRLGFIFLCCAAIIGLASCNKEEAKNPVPEQKSAAVTTPSSPCPAGGDKDGQHLGSLATQTNPHGGEKRSHAVVVPEIVEKTWKSVTIKITDKQAKTDQQVTINVGDTYEIPNSSISLRVLHFLPDFAMNSFGMTSKSNEPDNPAVNFEVHEDDKKLFTGWLFSKFPDVHTFNHDRYSFNLVGWQQKQ
ncbi:MAG: DUF2155 domain-containing protein [Xanthomonadaceae bacterium]|nr:DUF2155 domain-containing protein [Xanthomonadaceae bacterium]